MRASTPAMSLFVKRANSSVAISLFRDVLIRGLRARDTSECGWRQYVNWNNATTPASFAKLAGRAPSRIANRSSTQPGRNDDQERLVGGHSACHRRRLCRRRVRADETRGAGQAAPGGNDAAGQVLRPARGHGARQGAIQQGYRGAKRRISRGALEAALGRLRRKHQGREERQDRGPPGDLERYRQVQAGPAALRGGSLEAGPGQQER